MAPSKKGKGGNKKSDASPKKDIAGKKRKRKLSDMLGTQWSKVELQHFYEAYRKYGQDWKKVAAIVRNRSVEMVEAVYTLNKAYLSLPEGTASVAGLIAMMTDHYSVLEGSDSGHDTDDASGSARKFQKRVRGKFGRGNPEVLDSHLPESSNSQPVGLSRGFLSLLDERSSGGTRPRAVGKRTPRVPVSHIYDRNNAQKYFSSSRHGFKYKTNANDDDVAREIALALTETSQRGGSPQDSQTPKRKRENVMSSPSQNVSRRPIHTTESEWARSKLSGNEIDEEGFEGSLGSTEADIGLSMRDRKYLMETEGVGTLEVQKKGGFFAKNLEMGFGNHSLDDIKEACSGTEQEQSLGSVERRHESEVAFTKNARSSFKGPKKTSKKVLFGAAQGSEFEALQALADLSLMLPSDDDAEYEKENGKTLGIEENKKLFTSGGGNVSDIGCAVPESKEKLELSIAGTNKRKQKSLASKATDEIKFASKSKRSPYDSTHQKQGRTGKSTEPSSSSTDRRERDNSVGSTVEVLSPNKVYLPTKVRSRRKLDARPGKNSENIGNEQSISSFYNEEKLTNSLSLYRIRRWCLFEWFYSAIDYPWFARKEFVEYIDHVGLDPNPRLTRVEWNVIRSSLGKPRRFCKQFLSEEKEKLYQYRESVRAHYSELRAGKREGLPADLAKPLSVGQHVIAIHPKTREIHDGSVLTVEHSRCCVQFDRPELGVEFVKDIDCMPLNPWESLPASLVGHNFVIHKRLDNSTDLEQNDRLKDQNIIGNKILATKEILENSDDPHISTHLTPNLLKQMVSSSANMQAKVVPGETANSLQVTNLQPLFLAQIQAKEADVQALSQLTRALDKKEAVVSELRRMNDEVFDSQKDGENSLKDSETFKNQYAAVLLQLNGINDQVWSALSDLRKRNTYQENLPLMGIKPTVDVGSPISLSRSSDDAVCDTPKLDPNVIEIIESSRIKSHAMVDAALQAISTLQKAGDDVQMIEEVIDHVNNHVSSNGSYKQAVKSTAEDSSHKESDREIISDWKETQIPSELIARCVATLLMIQKCTERQFPPAEVAQILHHAVTSLQPCSTQNLPIYMEIEKCMGIIRNQLLALIPT